MSGGHFDYSQYRINEIIDGIEDIIEKNNKPREEPTSSWESEFYYEYPEDIIDEFKRGLTFLKIAKIYAQRIDWLVSGDDGEDSFRERLLEDLKKLREDGKENN